MFNLITTDMEIEESKNLCSTSIPEYDINNANANANAN